MDFDKLKKVLRPDPEVLSVVQEATKMITDSIRAHKQDAVCMPGGSVAKNTFLKDDFDVDLFVIYKEKGELSDKLEEILPFKTTRLHGSRDYFQFKHKGLNFEVVPVLKTEEGSKPENVTDMSPLHVEWVRKHLKPDQEDEIRLAKKFCKAANVYGAESHIRGFSGHVIDILIINYGDFISLLKASLKWKPVEVIDIEQHYRNTREILLSMNQSKIKGPMIVVDPIDKTRNAASALNLEKLNSFKERARLFLAKPDPRFFAEQPLTTARLKKRFPENLVVLKIIPLKGKRDVVGAKLLKAFRYLKTGLLSRGFELKDSGWGWDRRCLFYFVFKEIRLPETTVVEGPPLDMAEHVADFKKKYKRTFSREGKIHAEHARILRDAIRAVDELMRSSYVSEKIAGHSLGNYK